LRVADLLMTGFGIALNCGVEILESGPDTRRAGRYREIGVSQRRKIASSRGPRNVSLFVGYGFDKRIDAFGQASIQESTASLKIAYPRECVTRWRVGVERFDMNWVQ
jgi:hypothetical protein